MNRLAFTVAGEQDGQRIDRFLTEQLEDMTRTAVQKLCDSGLVLADGKPANKNLKLKAGQEISVEIPEPAVTDVAPQDIPLDIVFEDDWVLVVNKPKGMVVHPAAGNPDGTLVNALLYHCGDSLSGIGGVIRPGIVHRIDKDTSGLLLVAKNDVAHQSLSDQLRDHSCDRIYEAVVYGGFKDDSGEVDKPIGRHPVNRKQMAVLGSDGREAKTLYSVVRRYQGFTHLSIRLETGRTHQIRVHMAYLGHPVAGDPVYGPKKVITQLDGQCLHAKTIAFNHPKTGERLSFDSPLPAYFTKFLSTLKPTEID